MTTTNDHDFVVGSPAARAYIAELPTDGVNLDCISQTELTRIAVTIRTSPVRAARALFPNRPAGYVTATYDLQRYAWNKIAAMSCRLRGDINAASVYEQICDRIYGRLPEYARW